MKNDSLPRGRRCWCLGLASLCDDETLKNGLPAWADAAQIAIITLSASAVVPCATHIRTIRRAHREPATR